MEIQAIVFESFDDEQKNTRLQEVLYTRVIVDKNK